MTKAAEKTTDGPAGIVALEQLYPKGTRLIDDDLALQIAPKNVRVWAKILAPSILRDGMFWLHETLAPGMRALFPSRKRYIEDMAADAVAHGVKAVVNLGAGLDTLVYRSDALEGLPAWEVDQPGNISAKREGLERVLGKVPDHITLVPMDFDHQDLSDQLAKAGYLGTDPTLFVLEAVTQYLTDEGLEATFQFLSQAPQGSRLLFTYVKKSFLTGEDIGRQKYLYKGTVQKGLWLFGLAPKDVADFLAPYGWEIVKHESSEDIAARYTPATGRAYKTMSIEPVVYAVKR